MITMTRMSTSQRERTCRLCGQEFGYVKRGGNQPIYCSDPCRRRAGYLQQKELRSELTERRCSRCGETKSIDEFSAKTHAYCNPCHAAYARERRSNWTPEQKEARRRQEVAYRYGVTVDQLAELLKSQGRRCAICRTALDDDDRHWTVDHDHSCCSGTSGKGVKVGRPRGRGCGQCIRGILCSNCNGGLGLLRDDPALLRAAAVYLERAISLRSERAAASRRS